MDKELIIDIKNGNIKGNDKEETVILKGKYLNEDSNYINDLTIIIKDDNGNLNEYPIRICGKNFKIFIGKFSSGNRNDIFLCGDSCDVGKHVIAIVYGYNDGKLEKIFNLETFSEKYKYIAKYKEDYKTEVVCLESEKRYILDISTITKEDLKQIYNGNGKIIINKDPIVSYVNKIELVNNLEDELIKILLCQSVIGISDNNNLGMINNVISIKDKKIEILDSYIVSRGENVCENSRIPNLKEQILSYLPEDTVLINLNKFGGSDCLVIQDIDGDGRDEILCGYKSKNNQYIAAFRENEGIVKELDKISGEGYDVSDLIITTIKPKCSNNILIGWRIGSIWSVLDILEFKNDKFNKLLNEDKINYSKIEIIEVNNRKGKSSDIALWTHETGEAYKVQIYSFRGDVLEKTFRSDKEYFEKVEKYYIELINRTRETPQYLYYLIDAEYRSGKRKEAIENINKALKHPRPYPSLEELKRLKKKICN